MTAQTWTVREVLRWTTERFERALLGTARLDAEVLLAYALQTTRLQLYLDHDKPLAADELAAYRQLIQRRLEGTPVAYLVGQREFYSLTLRVSPAVLVPRPETELLVEVALTELRREGARQGVIVDLGTGSGAIALALASALPERAVLAVDVDEAALEVARGNAQRLGLAQVRCLQSDLLAALPADLEIALLVANLPYLCTSELLAGAPEAVSREVREHEPHLALDGGVDGLSVISRLIPQAARRLGPGVAFGLEAAPAQMQPIAELLEAAGFGEVVVHRDLGNLERVIWARRLV